MKMKYNINAVLILFSILLVMASFSACKGQTGVGLESTEQGSEAIASTPLETPTESEMPEERFLLNGVDVGEFFIVCGKNEPTAQRESTRLRDEIFKKTGEWLAIATDARRYDGGKEILVGYTNRMRAKEEAGGFCDITEELAKDEAVILSDKNFIYLGGATGNNVAVITAVDEFIKALDHADGGMDIGSAEPIKIDGVATYRIVTYNDGDNLTTNGPHAAQLLLDLAPDIIGMQEVQRAHATGLYLSLMRNYGVVYYECNDFEVSSPILYRNDRFTLVESGTEWLSDTPDEVNSKYSDSDYVRSYIYAILRDNKTGLEIVVVNTHIDYVYSANVKQVKKLIELTEKFHDRTVVYTADWNMSVSAEGFRLMRKAGFVDSGTAYGKSIPENHIDFIFVDTNKVTVNDYRYVSNHLYSTQGKYPASDHDPVYSEIAIFYKN